MSTMSRFGIGLERVAPTRVSRFYRGGALIDRLQGRPEQDGFFPEDWTASVTSAQGSAEPAQGLARLADGTLLRDRIAADPERWLGSAHVERFGTSTGLLVKLLDTAERLPVHFHPDRAFAAAHLGAPFGKTEAWIVLATREETADVWVGLREPATAASYRTWIERQDTASLLHSLHRVTVRRGDVVYVPAGVPHAIDSGLLIAELQEPTDFSFVCEWEGFPISPDEAHLELGWDLAEQALDRSAHTPVLALPDAARAFFWADGEATADGRFAILLVLEGNGTIDGEPAGPGDAFALPAALDALDVTGDLRVLRCLGPDPAVS